MSRLRQYLYVCYMIGIKLNYLFLCMQLLHGISLKDMKDTFLLIVSVNFIVCVCVCVSHTHTHAHTQTHTHVLTPTHIHVHTQHTYTHAYTIHTCTNTHTHIMCTQCCVWNFCVNSEFINSLYMKLGSCCNYQTQ